MKLTDAELRAMRKPTHTLCDASLKPHADYLQALRFNTVIDELLAARRFVEEMRPTIVNHYFEDSRAAEALAAYDKVGKP